jgi:chemotaxis protein MotA
MDVLSIVGVVIAFGAILVGQYLEGGHLITLLNGPAILIVGGGIAVAFVTTIYGVGLANLSLLPAGNKLKSLIR